MKDFLHVLRAFLEAQRGKESAKLRWKDMKFGQDGYEAVREEFRRADDTAEVIFQELFAELNASRIAGDLEELLESVPEVENDQLRRVLSERGMISVLSAEATSFEDLLRKVSRAGNHWTSAKHVNFLRTRSYRNGDFSLERLTEALAQTPPPNVEERAWTKVLKAFNLRMKQLKEEHNEASEEDIVRGAAFDVEQTARQTYDKISAKLVTMMQGMVENGSFGRELAVIVDPAMRRSAQDFVTHVPLPKRQTQTQTKPQTRCSATTDFARCRDK